MRYYRRHTGLRNLRRSSLVLAGYRFSLQDLDRTRRTDVLRGEYVRIHGRALCAKPGPADQPDLLCLAAGDASELPLNRSESCCSSKHPCHQPSHQPCCQIDLTRLAPAGYFRSFSPLNSAASEFPLPFQRYTGQFPLTTPRAAASTCMLVVLMA
jgi:hypothetical protein